MSETTGPASPAPPAADTSSDFAPAPDTRPELSVSDAARMLRNHRRAQPAPPPGDNSGGYGHNSGEAPPPEPARPRQTPPESAQPGGMSALERALGLDSGDAPDAGDSVSRETLSPASG